MDTNRPIAVIAGSRTPFAKAFTSLRGIDAVELGRIAIVDTLRRSNLKPDEIDEVVGNERRDVIHRDGLKHRAVHIFALNKKGEIFLQKRSRLKDKCPGLWDSSAAGHVDAG